MTNDQIKAAIVRAYGYTLGGDNIQLPEPKHLAGRFLEELTELALALGLTAGEILAHVADALANEARKKNSYPSELQTVYTHEDRDYKKEIPDCWVQLQYLSSLLEISESDISRGVQEKIELILNDAKNGKLYVNERQLFYRIK